MITTFFYLIFGSAVVIIYPTALWVKIIWFAVVAIDIGSSIYFLKNGKYTVKYDKNKKKEPVKASPLNQDVINRISRTIKKADYWGEEDDFVDEGGNSKPNRIDEIKDRE
jgi:hypothetical protein